MRKKKRVNLLVMALLGAMMIFCFSGCGKKEAEDVTESTVEEVADNETQTVAEEIDGGVSETSSENTSEETGETVKTVKFSADIHTYTKEEGGRHTPIFSNYRPIIVLQSGEVEGLVMFLGGIEMVTPGEDASITVEFESEIEVKEGEEFTIKESDDKIVATGTVKTIY